MSANTGALGLVAAIALGFALAYGPGATAEHAAATTDQPVRTSAAPSATSATAALADLPVRVEDTGAHYNRDQWGDWTTGRDGCTTRETVLRRDGHDVTTSATRRDRCRVTGGTWTSTYDDATISTPGGVQIDHRVPVKEAMRSGARGWTAQQRAAFYNDPSNLVAVSARANTSKGDRDPGRWRPSARESWCGYAAAYIATKTRYRLSVDPAERDGLAAMLRTCPVGAQR